MSSVNPAFIVHSQFVKVRMVIIAKRLAKKECSSAAKLLLHTLKDIQETGISDVCDRDANAFVIGLKNVLFFALNNFDTHAMKELSKVAPELDMQNLRACKIIKRKSTHGLGDLDYLPFDVREMVADIIGENAFL